MEQRGFLRHSPRFFFISRENFSLDFLHSCAAPHLSAAVLRLTSGQCRRSIRQSIVKVQRITGAWARDASAGTADATRTCVRLPKKTWWRDALSGMRPGTQARARRQDVPDAWRNGLNSARRDSPGKHWALQQQRRAAPATRSSRRVCRSGPTCWLRGWEVRLLPCRLAAWPSCTEMRPRWLG